jgi:hypothetical protein
MKTYSEKYALVWKQTYDLSRRIFVHSQTCDTIPSGVRGVGTKDRIFCYDYLFLYKDIEYNSLRLGEI